MLAVKWCSCPASLGLAHASGSARQRYEPARWGVAAPWFCSTTTNSSPQAGHGILLAHATAQALNVLEQQVAHLMAPGVVQGLEVVQVHKQHGRGRAWSARTVDQHLLQPVHQQAAVGQLRECVIKRQVAGLSSAALRPEMSMPSMQNISGGWPGTWMAWLENTCTSVPSLLRSCSSPAGITSPVANIKLQVRPARRPAWAAG